MAAEDILPKSYFLVLLLLLFLLLLAHRASQVHSAPSGESAHCASVVVHAQVREGGQRSVGVGLRLVDERVRGEGLHLATTAAGAAEEAIAIRLADGEGRGAAQSQ